LTSIPSNKPQHLQPDVGATSTLPKPVTCKTLLISKTQQQQQKQHRNQNLKTQTRKRKRKENATEKNTAQRERERERERERASAYIENGVATEAESATEIVVPYYQDHKNKDSQHMDNR